MADTHDLRGDDGQRVGPLLGDGICRNGVDSQAGRRAHMRELTMARQAAERRHARPSPQPGMDRSGQLAAAQERAVELRIELARLDASHREWLHAQGEDVPELRTRQGDPSFGKRS